MRAAVRPARWLQRRCVASLLDRRIRVCLADAAFDPGYPEEHRRGDRADLSHLPGMVPGVQPGGVRDFVKRQPPSEFPFLGHVGQFWSSYSHVYRASKDGYPFNFGYHVMILVIGTSTTVEYALRSAYETLIGRVSELTQRHGMTEEDRVRRESRPGLRRLHPRPAVVRVRLQGQARAPVDRDCAVGTGPAAQVGAQVRADHRVRHQGRIRLAHWPRYACRATMRRCRRRQSLSDHLPEGVEARAARPEDSAAFARRRCPRSPCRGMRPSHGTRRPSFEVGRSFARSPAIAASFS